MDSQLSAVFGDWLSRYSWDYFGTFTFSMPRRSSGIGPVVRWWSRMAANSPSLSAQAFIADEFHRDRERIHVHALLWSDPIVDQSYLWGSWQKYWGRERILKFNPHLGAAHYCGKYMLKQSQDRAEWRFVEWREGLISDGSDIELIEP